MDSPLLIRAVALYLPAAVSAAVWLWRRPNKRQAASALLAGAWCLPSLLLINVAAARFGWWRFEVTRGSFLGTPVDLLIGWVLLWGPLASLALSRISLPASIAILAAVDCVLMPLGAPVVTLAPRWLIGEGVAITVCLVPAQLLARWTEADIRVSLRAALQAIAFTGLAAGVLPALILSLTGGSIEPMLRRPFWLNSLYAQLLAVPAIIGFSAVQEFALRGHGTPLPYDPPVRLVRTGAYRYVANPMQLAMSVGLFCGGAMISSWWVAAAGIVAIVYSAGIAWWDEGRDMRDRFGESWVAYRAEVRPWIPRWRPIDNPPATIHVAATCGLCQGIGNWIACRNPVGLTIVPAESHPRRSLTRITYECEGYSDEGVAAFARALEHINAAWAIAGLAMRLPIVAGFLQLVADASGAGPLRIKSECPRAGVNSGLSS